MFTKAKRIVALALVLAVTITFMPVTGGQTVANAATTKAHSTEYYPNLGGVDNTAWGVTLSTDKGAYKIGEDIHLSIEGATAAMNKYSETWSWIGIFKDPSDHHKNGDLSYYWAYTGKDNGETGGTVTDTSDFVIYGNGKDAKVRTNTEITEPGVYYIMLVTKNGAAKNRYAALPIQIVDGDYSLTVVPDETLAEPIIEANLPGLSFSKMYNLGGEINIQVKAPATASDEMWVGFYDAGAMAGHVYSQYAAYLYAKDYADGKTFDLSADWETSGSNVENSFGYRAIALFADNNQLVPLAVEYVFVREHHTGEIVKLSQTEFEYNGKVQKPEVTGITFNTSDPMKYIKNVDIPESVAVGEYTVTVTLGGRVSGEPTGKYKIVQKAMTADMIGAIADQAYTGSPIKPALNVTLGDLTLKEGTDYTVTYRNNVAKGTATVTIAGKGNFKGTASKTFAIKDAASVKPDSGTTTPGTTPGSGTTTPGTTPDAGTTTPGTTPGAGTTNPEGCAHSWQAATCTVPKVCALCGLTEGAALGHTVATTEVVKKATATKAGQKVEKCSCGEVVGEPITIKAAQVTLSKAGVNYTGKKVKAPTVVVKDGNGKKIAAANYTVTKPKNVAKMKDIGRYTYTVKFKSTCPEYTGTVKVNFEIKPLKATIKAPAAAKNAITVKWKAVPKAKKAQITGYEVQVATDKAFTKGVKKTTVKGYAKSSAKVSKLKAKTKYFVKVRTYKTVKGVKIYSDWSAVKTIKAK